MSLAIGLLVALAVFLRATRPDVDADGLAEPMIPARPLPNPAGATPTSEQAAGAVYSTDQSELPALRGNAAPASPTPAAGGPGGGGLVAQPPDAADGGALRGPEGTTGVDRIEGGAARGSAADGGDTGQTDSPSANDVAVTPAGAALSSDAGTRSSNQSQTANAAPAPRVRCGEALCPEGQVCCNASCGICTAPGGTCTKRACGMPYAPTSAACGPVTCNVGQVCCNASCGICTAPNQTCDKRQCEDAIQNPVSEVCGMTTCNVGQVCCNPSCGICTAPGAGCSHEVCD